MQEHVKEHEESTVERTMEGTRAGKAGNPIGVRKGEKHVEQCTAYGKLLQHLRWNFANFLFLKHLGLLGLCTIEQMQGGGGVKPAMD